MFLRSDINLKDDWYLKKHMDTEGWVDINLIAEFNRVSHIFNKKSKYKNIHIVTLFIYLFVQVKRRTKDINVVKEAVKYSRILEFHVSFFSLNQIHFVDSI